MNVGDYNILRFLCDSEFRTLADFSTRESME